MQLLRQASSSPELLQHQPDIRTALLNCIIQDLTNEFLDLHPSFLKLCDASMKKVYLTSLHNVVFVASNTKARPRASIAKATMPEISSVGMMIRLYAWFDSQE